jgi:hypothetical protein
MTNPLLKSADREEALSRAYVDSVAAGAGYVVATMNFDRDGVDVEIRAGGALRPCLDLQLKATINLGEAKGGAFRFPLKRRNYDLLRETTMVPRLLVVLSLPVDESKWLTVTADQLILRRCAFWANLTGSPETENQGSITVSILEKNLFDVDGLKALMKAASNGVIT